ncbi:MAG: aromatic amino acid lyase, partial [Myxococcota bacterium]
CGATSIEALKASVVPFDERLHRVRPHPGQAAVAHNMRRLLADSEIMASHVDCEKVQDPYSLRCMPQVHGASRDALRWVEQSVTREINSVTDNPTVFLSEDGADVLSGGNFHGQPMAIAFDTAAIATAELANISERRVEQLVNPSLSTGLPPFLAGESGLCSGFMIAQVAAAALVSENKGHCHPASVDSIPSSANREDHVSMGSIAATKFARVVDNVEKGLAIELLAAVQGVDARRPLRASPAVEAVHALVRRHVAPYADDRPLHLDFACVGGLIREGQVCRAVEAVVGPLE